MRKEREESWNYGEHLPAVPSGGREKKTIERKHPKKRGALAAFAKILAVFA